MRLSASRVSRQHESSTSLNQQHHDLQRHGRIAMAQVASHHNRKSLLFSVCWFVLVVMLMGWLTLQLNAEETNAEMPTGWVSFRNGPHNPGVANEALADSLELKWEYTTPDGSASTPVIADGRVYAGTLSGDIHCFELATGQLVWTYKSVEMVAPNDIPPGFNAALALNAASVFGGDDFGTFHAVDRATGDRQWIFETDSEIVGGAQVIGEHVIFGSHDGYLYCLQAATGEIVWKSEAHGPVNGTPTLDRGKTFTTGCDQPVLRVFEIQEGKSVSEVPLDALLIASAAARDGLLYFGTDGGSVHALPIEEGKTGWTFSVPGREQQIHSSPAMTDEVLVIGSRDKNVHCVDRLTGKLRWSFATRGRVDSSPVIAGDQVYFGSSDRNLYAVKLEDGTELWKYPTKQPIAGSAAIADGYLVIMTENTNGRILCFGTK